MSVRTCFILLNYLLAALGVWCLAFIDTFSATAILTILSVLAVCMYFEMKKILPVKPPAGLSLFRGGLVLLPLTYFTLSPSIIDFTAYALVFILVTRFIFKTALNDYLYGHLLAIVCLLSGAIFIQDLVFGMIFLTFYLVLCWGLIFYNLMVERVGSDCPPETFKSEGEREMARASLFVLSGTMVAASLFLTIAIFISFPRLGLGFMSLSVQASPLSGFSESVALGDIGKIKLNESVVMRVEFTKNSQMYRPKNKILWRGVTLDHYKNQIWTSTMPRAKRSVKPLGEPLSLFSVKPQVNIIQQNVYMEVFDSSVIFTYGIPLRIDGSFKGLEMDQGYVLRTTGKKARAKRFTMDSDIGLPDASYSAPVPKNFGDIFPKRFLQLPDLHPEIVQLANDVVGDAPSSSKKAERILKRLRNNYGYSLDLVNETGQTGLYEFLFRRREGHCEYFASAMVVLLRVNGIPSRMVNGFAGGEWNDLGNYLIVRQKHAHSWVEAYLPGQGWMVFDPTPPDPALLDESFRNPFAHHMDLMRLYWQRYVVKYTFKDQKRIVSFFDRGSRDMIRNWKSLKKWTAQDVIRHVKENIWIPVTVGGIVLLLFLLRQSAWWQFASAVRTPYSVTLYRQMLKRCARLGISKESNRSHTEFLKQVASLPESKRKAIETITRFYERCRFGARPAPAKERQQMQALLRQI